MCHWHVEYELIRVLAGKLLLRVDEREFLLSAGESILLRGGDLHSGEPDNCVYECAVFSISPLTQLAGCREQLAPLLGKNARISRVYTREEDDICRAVDDFFEVISRKKSGYKLAAVAGLYRIFSIMIERELYQNAPREKQEIESRYISSFKNVLTWLEEHYSENITLDEMADVAGFSPKYFCRLFSKMTGRSPIDYLNCYRIDRASEMLLGTEKSIIDIAAECGFYDLSYFVKVFKKYKGLPPGQYRKRLGE